jgi:hypothetical protein
MERRQNMATQLSKTARERVQVEDRLLKKLKKLLKEQPITEVVGKVDLPSARCCAAGTYAIVRIDRSVVMKKKS